MDYYDRNQEFLIKEHNKRTIKEECIETNMPLFLEIVNDRLSYYILKIIYNKKNKEMDENAFYKAIKDNLYSNEDTLPTEALELILNLKNKELIKFPRDKQDIVSLTYHGQRIIDVFEGKEFGYQYNYKLDDYVLIPKGHFLEYRNARRYIASEEDLRNTYVLYRGCDYSYNFLGSNGKPCEKLEDVTLFDNYNKAYEFLRTVKDSSYRVYNVYELNDKDKVYKEKHNNLTVCNGRLCYLKDVL